MIIRLFSQVEVNMISVERIREYSQLKNEAPWEIPQEKPRKSWPEDGQVTMNQYGTRYRKELDLVLKDISCVITSGEKVRTVKFTYEILSFKDILNQMEVSKFQES